MRTVPAQVVVLAKSPIAGKVKTRLCPPYTPQEAAVLAAAALRDTLTAVVATGLQRHVIALDGTPGEWLPSGVEVLAQRGAGLDERIAAAMTDAYRQCALPVLLIGMDTPQVTPAQLETAAHRLLAPQCDAVLGASTDGGFWLLGLRRPRSSHVTGVPMSTATTGIHQAVRLQEAGLRVTMLSTIRDVDTAADVAHVASAAPTGAFAAAVQRLGPRPPDVARGAA